MIHKTTDDPLALFTAALATITLLLVGVVTVQVRDARRVADNQNRDMRTSLRIALRSAKASRKAAEAAEKSANALPAVERGYVFECPELTWEPQGDPKRHKPIVSCKFTNHGRTPVVLWRYEADFRMLSRSVAEPDNTTEHMPIYLFPGGQVLERGEEWAPPANEIPAFDQAVMDTIDSGHTFIWFYGRMTYEDIFGNPRETRFRWRYNGLAKGSGLSFMPYGQKPYNERT